MCRNGQMFYEDSPVPNITAVCDENAEWSFKSEKTHCYRGLKLKYDTLKCYKVFFKLFYVILCTFLSFKLSISLPAPSSVSIKVPKISKENEEVKIRCLFSDDANPPPQEVEFFIDDKVYIRETVSSLNLKHVFFFF